MERKLGIGVAFEHFLCPVSGNFASNCDFVNPSPKGWEFDQNNSCCYYTHIPSPQMIPIRDSGRCTVVYHFYTHIGDIGNKKFLLFFLNLMKIHQNKFLHFKLLNDYKCVLFLLNYWLSCENKMYIQSPHSFFFRSMYYATKCNINTV